MKNSEIRKNKEVWEYFYEKYEKSNVRVTPGHWPDFKTKEEVDKWIKRLAIIEKSFDLFEEEKEAEK